MKKGFQSGLILCPMVDKMCHRAENDASVPQRFDISNLLNDEEWEITTTNHGHVTLGQLFCRRVENKEVKNVSKTGKKTSRGLTEYERT